MKHNITYFKDALGQNYIGVKISNTEVSPFLNQLKDILGEEYDVYVSNQQKRDLGSHHVTVLNVSEYNNLTQEIGLDKFINSLEPVFKAQVDDLRFMGLGKATKNENTAYFVVLKSDLLQEVRRKYGLSEKDFHITLGFKHKDVHGVPKNEVLKTSDPFLSRLKKEY